jgi:hypothetical protein
MSPHAPSLNKRQIIIAHFHGILIYNKYSNKNGNLVLGPLLANKRR